MVNLAMIFAVALVAILAVYFVIHKYFPTFGTIGANIAVGIGAALEVADSLPWGTVLTPQQAAMVLFALATANAIMRLRGPKAAVGSA